MNAEIFLSFFQRALDRVNHQYYGIELWNEDMLYAWGIDEEHPQREAIQKYLSRYGERHFCYELYHKIRCSMESYYAQNPDTIQLYLQAELKKQQIHDVISIFPRIQQGLDKEYIPDFLLHSPGHDSHQEVVVEVKTNPRLSWEEIKEDLDKLQQFIERYNYNLGIFLYVNVEYQRLINLITTDDHADSIRTDISYMNQIRILVKNSLDAPLFEASLGELVGE